MSFPINPYTNRRVIKKANEFYGREKELQEIFTFLSNSQSCSIVGDRRIGKSSLLYALSMPEIQSRFIDFNFKNYVFAYIDLSAHLLSKVQNLFKEIIKALSVNYIIPENIDNKDESIIYEVFDDFISKFHNEGKKIVLLFDEFDEVVNNNNLNLDFFKYLRSLANNYSLSYITASRNELYNLKFSQEHILSSPFFNIFNNMFLGLLSKDSAIALINEPANQQGVKFETNEVDEIINLSGYNPYFIQVACYCAFEQKSQQGKIDFEKLKADFIDKAGTQIRYIYEQSLDDNDRKNLYNLINSNPTDDGIIRKLRRRGIIDNDKIFSKFFEEYILLNYQASSINYQASSIKHQASSIKYQASNISNQSHQEIIKKIIEKGNRIDLKDAITSIDGFISQNSEMRKIISSIDKIALSNSTVLITGESGTGKEIIARTIHQKSRRRDRPYLAINCGALPENILESELFGHIKGSFTDAITDRKGKFEEANGGTIFLDEIGETSTHFQTKLLRVLQEGEIQKVGDNKIIKVNVRIISATNKDLQALIKEGKFREDLFYRINVIPINLPPLRERKDDIPYLCAYFINKFNTINQSCFKYISLEALKRLLEYDYRGNIRELENILERVMVMTDGDKILSWHLLQFIPTYQNEIKDDVLSASSEDEILFEVNPYIDIWEELTSKYKGKWEYANDDEKKKILLDIFNTISKSPDGDLTKALRDVLDVPPSQRNDVSAMLVNVIKENKIYPIFETTKTDIEYIEEFKKYYKQLKKLKFSDEESASILLNKTRMTLLRFLEKINYQDEK